MQSYGGRHVTGTHRCATGYPVQPFQQRCLDVTRRHFLRDCGVGLGKIALAGLLTDSLARGASVPADSLAPRQPHFKGKAKRVIHLFMAGAPSQLELFDYKPELAKLEGKPLPPSVIGGQRYAFIRPDAAVLGPRFKFAQHGQMRRGAVRDAAAPGEGRGRHLPREIGAAPISSTTRPRRFSSTPAFSQPGRPCLGSWVLYGLGAETQDLPAFVVMSTGSGLSGGSALWSSGFLPTVYTGMRFRNQGDPILNVSNPAGIDARLQRDTLDLIAHAQPQRRSRRSAIRRSPRASPITRWPSACRRQRAGADGPAQTRARRRSNSTAAIRTSRPSPAPACSRGA